MRIRLAWMLGLLAAANGVFMLAAPAAWYAIAPGVPNTGPLNAHFIRDIGAAFVVAGGSMVWFARDARARPAALACAAFFALHALVHLSDAIAGRESIDQAVRDLPTVYLDALVALWIAWPISTPAKEEGRDAQMVVTAADRRLRKGV
jgi:uncharacterized protein YjeT (DUF2065 family)